MTTAFSSYTSSRNCISCHSLNCHSCLHMGHSCCVGWEFSHFNIQCMWKTCEHWPHTKKDKKILMLSLGQTIAARLCNIMQLCWLIYDIYRPTSVGATWNGHCQSKWSQHFNTTNLHDAIAVKKNRQINYLDRFRYK